MLLTGEKNDFTLETLQWLLEEWGEKFTKGDLLLDIQEDGFGGVNGYIYDQSDIEYMLVNPTELKMYCDEYGRDEEEFLVDTFTIVRTSL